MSLERISHYRVHRLLGAGGMGEVYLAEDPTLRRKVALKLLPQRFADDPERIRRFQREALAASQLNHPNIITIYEVGRDHDRHYIATEYIEGQTLRDRIRSTQPMSVIEVVDIAIGITGALATAHEANILHRDIKPENVMLRPDGYVKVLDFGLAKLEQKDFPRDSSTNALMGTLLYLSPEQARGQSPDSRSDLYAIAAVIYEMLTRRPPIVTESFIELAISVATVEAEPPSRIATGIPPELDRIVLKGLQKDPAKRYQTAREMLADLRMLRRELEFENRIITFSPDPRAAVHEATARYFTPQHSSAATKGFRPARIGAIALIVLTAALIAFAVGRNAALGTGGPIDSVAVLPFANVSRDPNSEYLSDGIAESITDNLSTLGRLQVVARSTAFRYKGKDVDPVDVGKDLDVRGVVTGQLIARGDMLVIRASLIDVNKGTQVWGEQFTRKLADVLSVQREISEEISRRLRLRLTGEERRQITHRNEVEPEAYQAYLRGRYHLNRLTEEEVRKALAFFNQAIGIQPDYALAYAGVASSYYHLSNVYEPPTEAMPRARAAAQKAVEIDDSLAEGHMALGLVRTWYDWDFAAGEREFRRAIELNPNDADGYRFYGDFLVVRGQYDRALEMKRKAEQLDPLSVPASWDVGRVLYYAGRYQEADAQARRTLDLDPNFPNALTLRAQIAVSEGRLDEAVTHASQAIRIAGRKPYYVSIWGYVSALAGRKADAKAALEELRRSPDYALPLFLARIENALGNHDEALTWLEKLTEEKSESVVWLKVDPTLVSLRDRSRFQKLVERVGI